MPFSILGYTKGGDKVVIGYLKYLAKFSKMLLGAFCCLLAGLLFTMVGIAFAYNILGKVLFLVGIGMAVIMVVLIVKETKEEETK